MKALGPKVSTANDKMVAVCDGTLLETGHAMAHNKSALIATKPYVLPKPPSFVAAYAHGPGAPAATR